MHLIGPLVSGVRGCENGTARLYKRGGSSSATWYSGFNAENPSTDIVALDSNGGAVVYVGELVTVVCKDSGGNTVRTFTAGAGDDGVEVRSTSFVGADYVTNSQAAGKPTTLAKVLDLLVGSFGTTGFKVLFRGAATNLSTALQAADIFFNVISYGAKGDGVTDDTAAVQAALDAAYAAGGGLVFFPAGTYFTDGLTVGEGVSLLGVGGGKSVIEWDSPSGPAAAVAFDDLGGAAAGNYQLMQGLKLKPRLSPSTTVALFINSALLGVEIRECHFVTGNGQFFNSIVNCVADFYGCYFNHSNATTSNGSFSSCFARFYNCFFIIGSALTADILLSDGSLFLSNCFFDVSALSSGTVNVVSVEALLRMHDCEVGNNGGGNVRVIDVPNTATLNNVKVVESGNQFGNNTPYDMDLVLAASSFSSAEVILGSRRNLTAQYTTNAGADVDIDPEFETVYIRVVDATAFAITTVGFGSGGGRMPAGSDLHVVIENTSGGGSGNITFNDSTVKSEFDSSPLTLADTQSVCLHFKSCFSEESSGLIWFQVGTAVKVS